MVAFRRSLWVATGLYWAFIFVLTHIDLPPGPPGGINDKVAHVLAYGALAGAIYVTLWANRPAMVGLGWKVLVICAAYGAVDEWLQALPFIHRSCELLDWLADLTGILIAVGVLVAVRKYVSRRPLADKMPA
jgi:VanZ family protein